MIGNTRIYILTIIFLSGSQILPGQQKQTITHESMWSLNRVGVPKISPQGDLVVYSIHESSYDEKDQKRDLWLLDLQTGQAPRRLTAGKAGESQYSWSPDGKQLAFIAKREGDETAQLYVLPMRSAGEAQKLTNVSTGVNNPYWSPDGKNIAFTSVVFPECFADSCNQKRLEAQKKIKYKAYVYESFPIRSWDKWNDEKKTHLWIQSLEPGSQARDLFSNLEMAKESGFSFSDYCWTPDGKHVIISATNEANTTAFREAASALYKIDISSGSVDKLSGEDQEFSNPAISQDGKYLYCIRTQINNKKLYNLGKLIRYNWPSMDHPVIMADALDRPIESYQLCGDEVFLIVEDRGRDYIYRIEPGQTNARLFSKADKGNLNNLSCSKGSQPILVANYESVEMPQEVCLLNSEGQISLLTDVNKKKLESLQLSRYETLWFKSKQKKDIRSLMVYPPNFDSTKTYPLLVVMHGGPAGSWKEGWSYRWNYHLLAQPGYVLMLTDYTGSTGYGEQFSQDIQFDPFKGPADEINEAAADAIRRFKFIDGKLQAAAGASYGGHLANWMQATTSHYKCLVSHAGLVNAISQWGTSDAIYHRELMNGGTPWSNTKLWKDQNPIYFADQFQTPMLVTVGELDYRVPVNNSIENWNILQRMKIPSKLIVFPGENHWILNGENARFFYRELHDWLAKYLK